MKRRRKNGRRRMFRVTAVADRRPQLERLTGMPIGEPGSEQRQQMAALIVANYLDVVGSQQETDYEFLVQASKEIPLKMFQELVNSPQCSQCGTIPAPYRQRNGNQPLCDRCILNVNSNREPASA